MSVNKLQNINSSYSYNFVSILWLIYLISTIISFTKIVNFTLLDSEVLKKLINQLFHPFDFFGKGVEFVAETGVFGGKKG